MNDDNDDKLKDSLNNLLDSENIDLYASSTDQIDIDGEMVTKDLDDNMVSKS